jgi:hypothetical protein
LRVQSLHSCERAPQRQTGDDKALAVPIEQRIDRGPVHALPHGPDVQIDDLSSERRVQAQDVQGGSGACGMFTYSMLVLGSLTEGAKRHAG